MSNITETVKSGSKESVNKVLYGILSESTHHLAASKRLTEARQRIIKNKKLNESFGGDAMLCDGFSAGYSFDIENSGDALEFIYDNDCGDFWEIFGDDFSFVYSEGSEQFVFSKDIPDNKTFDKVSKEIKDAVPKFVKFLKDKRFETDEKFNRKPDKIMVVVD